MYLVTIHWISRPVSTHYLTAQNESQAIMAAVKQNCKDNDELYNHTKSKAVRIAA